MIELMMVGGSYAFGVLLVLLVAYCLVMLVTYPFDLKAELEQKKSTIKRLDEQNDEYRKFITSKNLDTEYRRTR